MTSSLGAPKSPFSPSTFHHLYRRIPIYLPGKSFSSNHSLVSSQSLKSAKNYRSFLSYRRFSIRADAVNGPETRNFDFDLFTIGAGSGGVRASRFAANYGASVAICELPFATISSENAGGVGGTGTKFLYSGKDNKIHYFKWTLEP